MCHMFSALPYCPCTAPRWLTGSTADLYHVMIYMFLKPGTMDEQDPGYMFAGQGSLQVCVLCCAGGLYSHVL